VLHPAFKLIIIPYRVLNVILQKEEIIFMTKRKYIWLFLLIPLLWHGLGSYAEGCAGCWAGYGPGAERFNKPLADLRIIYEKDGRDALPYIREALRTSTDPLVMRRAAGYIAELNDTDSIPFFEQILSEILKRVAFSRFGFDSYGFQRRLAAAHALPKLGPTKVGEKIWKKYGRLDPNRKFEVPYILNALQDPNLDERLLEILSRKDDHQLMLGALDVLAIGGSAEVLPALRFKVVEWSDSPQSADTDPDAPVLYYSALIIKADLAISAIENRGK
jgi:hypothetical protein